MALYGLYHRGVARDGNRLGWTQVGCGAAGFPLMTGGLAAYLSAGNASFITVVIVGALFALTGMLLFLGIVVTDALRVSVAVPAGAGRRAHGRQDILQEDFTMTYSAFTGWSAPLPTPHGTHVPFIPRAAAGAAWTLRPATSDNEPEIRALLRAEGMGATRLHCGNIVVACTGAKVVGAAQVRPHRDGSCELDSLVVAPGFRGRGIGTALVRTLLACEQGRLHALTSRGGAATYERFGFRQVPGDAVPRLVRLHLRISQLAGLAARLRGRHPPRLCLLERPELPAQASLA